MNFRKTCILLLMLLMCGIGYAKTPAGGQKRKATTTRVQKKTARTPQKEEQALPKEEVKAKPEEPEIELYITPPEGQILQAKKDPATKKYGYENVGEKLYWWAEAHKLGKGKEELNSDQRIEWVISPQYDKVSKGFSEGLAAVEIGGKVGFIDQFNRFVIEPQFEPMDDMEGFHYGVAAVKKDGKYSFIDKRGNFVFAPGFEKAENFGDDKLAIVKAGGKYGCIDFAGDTVVPCTYIAKELMTTVPVKNKPYKAAQKLVKTKWENGYYTPFLIGVMESEDKAQDDMDRDNFCPIATTTPKADRGEVGAHIKDGYYLWTNGETHGIIDSYGRPVLQPYYKSVRYQPAEKIFIVEETSHGDGKPAFGLLNRSGGWVIPPVFESITDYKRGLADASVGDCRTKVNVNGLVEGDFVENMLKASAEEKGTYYTERLIGVWPTCAPAHNNMGIYYASSRDDLKHAINHFTVAHRLDPDNEDFKRNMKAAKSERNNRRWNRVLTGLQIAGAVLTIGAMTYSAVSGNTVMPSSDFASSGSSFSGTGDYSGSYAGADMAGTGSSSGGGMDEATYRRQYDRWADNAKSCYESLTLTGSRKKKNGKDDGGSAEGSWGGAKFTAMKKNLRNAQREMRKVRQEASRHGYSIPQSEYENINVTY